MSWREFWNHEHSIYVNARHRALHYEKIAKDIASLVPAPGAHVLDYGCGEALAADQLAQSCGGLALFDTAPSVREKLRQRFAANKNITILDEEALAKTPPATFDMIICNSVLQYLSRTETEGLMDLWHDRLKPGARLVIADVIPPDVHAATDIKALLAFAREGGFLFAALRGLVATFFSNYRTLRQKIGLSTYREQEMLQLLAKHGFKAARASRNIGHNQARMTFIATRSAESG